jgi:hypothetical protein
MMDLCQYKAGGWWLFGSEAVIKVIGSFSGLFFLNLSPGSTMA